MPTHWNSIEERREYHRNWRANLPPDKLEADRKRCRLKSSQQRIERNERLSEFPCICCGELDSDLIDWHHVVPDSKELNIKGCGGISETRWWDEVLKCVPVCALCHRKIHSNKLCLIPQIR